ncbi:MAG: Nif3-like dinuclear metal center hexameric protein, partial [Planctomycetes bacterium]|nr:Nif3-like dinuclear metal center hexameric protein [Planctomycetota bacterium]
MPTVHDVIQAMDRIAPPYLAMDGDPIGLHAGRRDAPVTTVSLSLDASLPALALADRMGADMMLVHHPRFYRGLSTLADEDPSGRRGSALVRSGKAVYSAHTNLDVAPGGTNDLLARAAGLTGADIVECIHEEAVLKLAVFVPASHIDPVLKAVTGAGAGAIGNYSDCTFRSRGVGTFRPGEGTTPFLGRTGKLEEADEFRLETVFGEYSRDKV